MNRYKSLGYCLGLLPAVLACFCSLPSEIEPVRWKMNIQLPVTDQRFYTKDLFPEEAIPGMELRLDRDTAAADTVTIVRTDSLSYSIEKQLMTTDTSTDEKVLGAQSLKNTPFVDVFFVFSEQIAIPGNETPLPAAVPVSNAKDEALPGIASITIDPTSPDLMITIENRSPQTYLEDITVDLLDGTDTIGSVSADRIDAASERVVPLSLSDKTIHDPITVAITVTIPEGAILESDDGLNVSFSLDGQVVASAVIADSMITYSDTVSGSFRLADSIDLSLVDLDDALLLCSVTNPAGLMVSMEGIINDAWEYDFAVENDLQSVEDLEELTDSSGFAGNIIDDTLFKSTSNPAQTIEIPLRNIRLFPAWNSDSGTSVLTYRYVVESLSDGRFIRFDKDDMFIFNLIPSRFPFIRIKGRFVEPTIQTFSSMQKVGFGWDSSITGALRESFRFDAALMNIDLTADLPDSSNMDSLRMHFTVGGDQGDDTVTVDETITGITPGIRHPIDADLSPVLNSWPDSISFDARMELPSGTAIDLYNEKNPDGTYKSTLSIGVAVTYTVEIPFCWEVLDTIRTELERSSFSPDAEALEWIRDIEDPSVSIELDALNNTNINLRLFAIGAAESYSDELDDFSGELIDEQLPEDALGDHLFSLFGNSGIILASRGERSEATVQLDERGIDALLSGHKCLLRWFLILPASDTDALTSADYIDLKATAIISGIGNTDTLLYEDN
ncbi:MAG: hypothetical protein JW863_17405 [Chitinispirillaceae bacterium]|nr:hypothetical protein [Chitinispirillaceae bacterium]